jgi:hypothetical protein
MKYVRITVIAPIEIASLWLVLDVNVRLGNEQAFEVVSIGLAHTRAVFSIKLVRRSRVHMKRDPPRAIRVAFY